MNRNDDKTLILRAASLAHAAPREWAAFLESFQIYADGEARLCVQANAEDLQRMQGRAQQCALLSTLLSDAVKTADRIASRPRPVASMAG